MVTILSHTLSSRKETLENLDGHYERKSVWGGKAVLRNKKEKKRKKC